MKLDTILIVGRNEPGDFSLVVLGVRVHRLRSDLGDYENSHTPCSVFMMSLRSRLDTDT